MENQSLLEEVKNFFTEYPQAVNMPKWVTDAEGCEATFLMDKLAKEYSSLPQLAEAGYKFCIIGASVMLYLMRNPETDFNGIYIRHLALNIFFAGDVSMYPLLSELAHTGRQCAFINRTPELEKAIFENRQSEYAIARIEKFLEKLNNDQNNE